MIFHWLALHGEKRLREKYPVPWQRVEAFRDVLRKNAPPNKPVVPVNKYGAGILDIAELLEAGEYCFLSIP